jgi:uncharacterized membrane protein
MADGREELDELRAQVAALTARVQRLEQHNGSKAGNVSLASSEIAATPDPPPPPQKPFIPASHPLAFVTKRNASGEEEETSLEGKIGGLWLNRVGIIATLFGVAYFLKLALDKNWIGRAGQVTLGLVIGGAIVVWSERFRRKGFAPFSYSLKAVGFGAIYLSLWAAAQYYHLMSAGIAFAVMVLVTACIIALALLQDAEVLATFALIGGFLTPVLLSTGEDHEIVVFSYVTVLNAAMLAMAAVKPWRRLLWGSFIGTILLYSGWFSSFYAPDARALTVFFAALFAAIFAAIPLMTPLKPSNWHAGASMTLTLLPLANAGAFFIELYAMYKRETESLTWYALALAAIYLALSRLAKRRAGSDPEVVRLVALLHLALAIGFLTVSVPLKLNEHWITIGWLVESGVLVAIAVYTRADYLRFFAGGALLLGIFRLLMIDTFQPQALIFNARFATYLVAIAVLSGIVAAGTRFASGKEAVMVKMAGIFLNLLALHGLTLEAAGYFDRQVTDWYQHSVVPIDPAWARRLEIGRVFSYSAVWLVYGAGLMLFGFLKQTVFVRWQALALMAFTIGKVFVIDVNQLDSQYKFMSFIALGLVLLGISYGYHRDWLKLAHKPSG